jgi:hypothetical protein
VTTTIAPNPNPKLNAWCPRCEEWTLRTNRQECSWCDALGFHFWPSRGLLIDAYECKSSRSDWLREVEDPAKADRFCQLVDRFYVVAGRADIVKRDEVPPDWGLLIPHGGKLKEAKPATMLHADSPAVAEWAAVATRGRRGAGPRLPDPQLPHVPPRRRPHARRCGPHAAHHPQRRRRSHCPAQPPERRGGRRRATRRGCPAAR